MASLNIQQRLPVELTKFNNIQPWNHLKFASQQPLIAHYVHCCTSHKSLMNFRKLKLHTTHFESNINPPNHKP